MKRFFGSVAVVILVACHPPPAPPVPPAPANDGAERYASLCASCHGPEGAGGPSGPGLRNWSRPQSTLVGIIADRMPPSDPTLCVGRCAEEVANYILETFVGAEPPCTGGLVGARGLRLLTRDEYLNTVDDLFGFAAASCGSTEFRYKPAAGQTLKTVHLAGSFNGWPGTIAGGGWPLQFDPVRGEWRLTRQLSAGLHAYKFVLDESQWVFDPAAPETAPDGFGGLNSVRRVSCAGRPTDFTLAALPTNRPDGFAFDNHVEARAVSALHVEAYLSASASLARQATATVDAFVGCDFRADRPGCARSFLARFGTRAFRRPLTGAEQSRYEAALAQLDFPSAVGLVVEAMLASPSFLYRSELGVKQADGTFQLDPYETASALSYTLWQSMPDQALFDAAAASALSSPQQREAHAQRLLADPRARRTVGAFATQWLDVERVRTVSREEALTPGFDAEVREAALEETRRFVTGVVFDGTHRYPELLTSRTRWVNQALAPLYGLSVAGEFQQLEQPGDVRAGVLGLVSVLAVTAHADQTSPVRRGLFVRRELLCQEYAAPPAVAGGLPPVDPTASTRTRFAQHSAAPACASCHRTIDPVGFGFERFDSIGRERTLEHGLPIESWGELSGLEGLGTGQAVRFETPRQLAELIAASKSGPACLVRQVRRFAHGRKETNQQRCAVEALERSFVSANLDVRALLISVVTAPDFTLRN